MEAEAADEPSAAAVSNSCAPTPLSATKQEEFDRQLELIRCRVDRLPGCGSWAPSGLPLPAQYAQLSVRPRDFAVISLSGRLANIALNLIVWTYGWRMAGASWLWVRRAPAGLCVCSLPPAKHLSRPTRTDQQHVHHLHPFLVSLLHATPARTFAALPQTGTYRPQHTSAPLTLAHVTG